MDFSSLVLIKRDKEGFFLGEGDSYPIKTAGSFIKKFYTDMENIYLQFDTGKDVEEWEFSAIFDLFNKEGFEASGYTLEDIEDEYNPTFLIKMNYTEDRDVVSRKLEELCNLIDDSMEKVFEAIIDKEEEYK